MPYSLATESTVGSKAAQGRQVGDLKYSIRAIGFLRMSPADKTVA
jgi:hypothetical protein